MSPTNPPLRDAVTDPRSTPGDHPAQGAPGRRGVIHRASPCRRLPTDTSPVGLRLDRGHFYGENMAENRALTIYENSEDESRRARLFREAVEGAKADAKAMRAESK